MTDAPASLVALGIEPAGWLWLHTSGRTELSRSPELLDGFEGWTETPLYSATDLARLIAQARRVEALEAALKAMLNATSEHDEWCAVGPIYRCSCDLHLANEQARAALKENTDD